MAADLIMTRMPVTVTRSQASLAASVMRSSEMAPPMCIFFVVVVQYARASRLFEVRWVVPPLNLGVLGQNYSWARAASMGVSHALLLSYSAKFVPSFRRSG